MEEVKNRKDQLIRLKNRGECSITGVSDVISLDEREVVLMTSQGKLCVKGNALKMKRFAIEQGEADFTGRVDAFSFSNLRSDKVGRWFGKTT